VFRLSFLEALFPGIVMIAKVVTDVAVDREFDYRVPEALAGAVRIGSGSTFRSATATLRAMWLAWLIPPHGPT